MTQILESLSYKVCFTLLPKGSSNWIIWVNLPYSTNALSLSCEPSNIALYRLAFKQERFKTELRIVEGHLTRTYQARGGGQRPGWPNSHLPIRNHLFYDSQTWWLLVFIFKTRSYQILAKFINQGGGVVAALFSLRHLENFENEKIFLCLKIAEINMGGGSILGREKRFWT